jgi:small subunit ribosomal protein S10
MSIKGQKIRIRLKAFYYEAVDSSAREIVVASLKANATVSGPIALPIKIEKWTVLRGPHIDKKAREQFERRTYKRVLDIYNCTSDTVDALTKLKLSSSGVSVDIKVLNHSKGV